MRAEEFIAEQQLDESISDTIDRILDKVLGPAGEPMQPGEFERRVGKIPANATTQEMEAQIAKYLANAKIEREAEELAWRNKTTVEKINHYLVKLAAVVFTYVNPEKLGQAIGDLIYMLLKALIRALLKRS
jgi:pentose-5-phosphate-3-epimerase